MGKCADYGICKTIDCGEFLNVNKQQKCTLHREEENMMAIKCIKSSRANLRSNFVDSVKVSSLRKHEKKMKEQTLGFGFKKTRVELNDYMITPEVREKQKLKQQIEQKRYKKFVEK